METPHLSLPHRLHRWDRLLTFRRPAGAAGGEEAATGQISRIGLEARDGPELMLGQSPPEGLAVGMPQGLRPLAKVCRRSGFHCGPRVKDGNAVGNVEGQVNVVGDEHHALALVRHGPEHGQGFLRLLQAHARGGLVGDDQPGAGEQSCGHQNPPGHAAGELEGVQPFRLLRQTKPAEELPAALCGPGLLFKC